MKQYRMRIFACIILVTRKLSYHGYRWWRHYRMFYLESKNRISARLLCVCVCSSVLKMPKECPKSRRERRKQKKTNQLNERARDPYLHSPQLPDLLLLKLVLVLVPLQVDQRLVYVQHAYLSFQSMKLPLIWWKIDERLTEPWSKMLQIAKILSNSCFSISMNCYMTVQYSSCSTVCHEYTHDMWCIPT